LGPGAEQHKAENIHQVVRDLAKMRGSVTEMFSDFCRMAACSLACQTREEEYLEIAGKYTRPELERVAHALANLVNDMELDPFSDLLGPIYMEIASKASVESRGEFYTPPAVCTAMAHIVVNAKDGVEKGLPITVLEPCVGSGGMVLAIAKGFAIPHKAVDLLRFTCWDISPLACDMAYINTTLWGIPAEIVWGDTLRATVNRSWKNIHWHRVGEDQRGANQKALDLVTQNSQPVEKAFDAKLPIEGDRKGWSQGEFDF
jgi:hypothetical protein